MASLTFAYGATSVVLTVHTWRLLRRVIASRFVYRTGAAANALRAAKLVIELQWEHLSEDEYDDVIGVVNTIRSNGTVNLTAASGLDYLSADLIGSGLLMDLDSDEVVESAGEYVEFMPMTLELICAEAVALSSESVDSWTWGDTDINFEDDLNDDPFNTWPN